MSYYRNEQDITTFNDVDLPRRRPTTDEGDEAINDIAPTHKDDYMWILGDDDSDRCSSKPSAGAAAAAPPSIPRRQSSRRNYREARSSRP